MVEYDYRRDILLATINEYMDDFFDRVVYRLIAQIIVLTRRRLVIVRCKPLSHAYIVKQTI